MCRLKTEFFYQVAPRFFGVQINQYPAQIENDRFCHGTHLIR